MPWEIILPIAASIIQGGISSALEANSASKENNRQRLMSQARRAELQPIIERLRGARDYFGVEENLVRDFSRAAEQMSAQSAQSGMTNAGRGGLDQVQRDALGAGLASLAQFKTQDEAQRQELLARILSDPSLYGGVGPADDTGLQTLLGGLGGGAAGLGSILTSFISTPEGLAALGGLFGAGSGKVPLAKSALDTNDFGSWLTSAASSTSAPSAGANFGDLFRGIDLAGILQGGGGNMNYSPDVYEYRPSY